MHRTEQAKAVPLVVLKCTETDTAAGVDEIQVTNCMIHATVKTRFNYLNAMYKEVVI